MIKRTTFLDMIAIFSLIIGTFSYIKISHPTYRLIGLMFAIVLSGLYVKLYIQESSMEQGKTQIEKMLNPIKSRLDKIEGWKEAVNYFLPNRKGVIDPITFFIIVIIIILIILYMQGRL